MNPQIIEYTILEKFGPEALNQYKAQLAEIQRLRKCWTCWDYFPNLTYEAHLSKCQPQGQIFSPVKIFSSSDPNTDKVMIKVKPWPTIPQLARVTKGCLYNQFVWPAKTSEHLNITRVPTTQGYANHFRLHAISLSLGLQTAPKDRKKLHDKGQIELFADESLIYSGPISSILTQQTIDGADPRRDVTSKKQSIDIDYDTELRLKLSGIIPKKSLDLTVIYYGIRLIPVLK